MDSICSSSVSQTFTLYDSNLFELIIFPQIVCTGLLIVLVYAGVHACDAYARADRHGNTVMATEVVCNPHGGCLMGGKEKMTPGGKRLFALGY